MVIVAVAVVGSVMVSHKMDRGADNGAVASTGRAGDPQPNSAQDQEHSKSSRGPSTSGSSTQGAVLPASRSGFPMGSKAEFFTDEQRPSAIRVDYIDEDGGCEVAIFDGPRAVERAARFASAFYGTYNDPEGRTKP